MNRMQLQGFVGAILVITATHQPNLLVNFTLACIGGALISGAIYKAYELGKENKQ